ncbi:MAG: cupin [Pseudomonadota bacterium]|nr:cupin [Pseudomonadota bacterium]
MTRLRIFTETDPTRATTDTRDGALITELLGRHGVRFERWSTPVQLAPGASQDEVIAAYRTDIDRLMAEGGYQAVDVVSLSPEHPDRATFREKFLNEHCHAEDEVRFFVAGAGLFTLHLDDLVFEVLCEQGDLIGVPDNTRHWFDMGPNPFFIAIRLFTNASGWVANFTGTDIALQFPRLEN